MAPFSIILQGIWHHAIVFFQGPLLCGLESGTNRILRLEEICMTATCVRAALHPNASKTLNPKP